MGELQCAFTAVAASVFIFTFAAIAILGRVGFNGDRGITLEELEALQARMADRQKVIAIKTDSAQDGDSAKRKNKDAGGNGRKSAL